MSYEIKSPMPAKIIAVNVQQSDQVSEETQVALMESMKMEIPVLAASTGSVSKVNINEGDFVKQGEVMFVIE